MQQVTLGQTGLRVSTIAFGTWQRRLGRDRLVIATKGRPPAAPSWRDHPGREPGLDPHGVEASLTALDTDYIDLYQLHWPDPATPFQATAEELAKLRADGKIRHVGVSPFDAAQMNEFSATLQVETLQPPYHPLRRDIEEPGHVDDAIAAVT
jgi:aryl-alcohol dehydrogenase-like predicted oxidoreductase